MSLLTTVEGLPPINPEKVGPHRYRRVSGRVLITSDSGGFLFLSEGQYREFLRGIAPGDPLYEPLRARGFIRDCMDFDRLAGDCVENSLLDWRGPDNHLVFLSRGAQFMIPDVARRTADFILRSPGPILSMEIAGGDLGRSWPVLRFLVDYARRKAVWTSRILRLAVRTGPEGLAPERLEFLAQRRADLRVRWSGGEAPRRGPRFPGARGLYVVGKTSKNPRSWVRSWSRSGLESVRLAPSPDLLSPGGAQRFLAFYRAAYPLLAAAGIREEWAEAFKRRIPEEGALPRERRPDPMPGLDVLSELAYSPAGRILAGEDGPDLGTVRSTAFEELAEREAVQGSVGRALGSGRPLCFQCAYKPYCSLSAPLCSISMGILDMIFSRLGAGKDKHFLIQK